MLKTKTKGQQDPPPLMTEFTGNASILKPVLSGHSKRRPKNGFQDRLSLNAGQKYSAILSTFIKLPFIIKVFVLSIF